MGEGDGQRLSRPLPCPWVLPSTFSFLLLLSSLELSDTQVYAP